MRTRFLTFAVASLVVSSFALAETKTTQTTTTTESFSSPPKTSSSKTSKTYKSGTSPQKSTKVTTETYTQPSSATATSGTAVMGGTTYGAYDYKEEQNLRTENMSFAPQFGTVVYTDQTGETDSRAMVGLGLNFGFLPASSEDPSNMYVGLSTGAWYSHLGSPNSNFWGQSDHSTEFSNGANMVMIPANLKIGFNISDSFRTSLRGGGNVIYRSVTEAARLGSGADRNTNEWALLPSAGLDLEWQVSDGVAIIARPDLTIAPGNNMFVGTLGASIQPF